MTCKNRDLYYYLCLIMSEIVISEIAKRKVHFNKELIDFKLESQGSLNL